MSDDRKYQAEIEALQKRVEGFWQRCYSKLHVLHVRATESLYRGSLSDIDDSPGNNPRTPSPK